MTSKMRTLLVGGALGTTVLVGLGGGAVAWAQTEGTTPPTTSSPAADGLPHARGQKLAELDAELAEALGTTTEAVSTARRSAHEAVIAELGEPTRPETRPTTPEERDALRQQVQARRDLFRQRFAEGLGVSVEDLRAAELAVAEERLAAKVAAGELTQEQADARLEALRTGEMPPGGLGGRGGHGGRGGQGGHLAEARDALAAELGTTPEALAEARRSAHEAVVAELGPMTRPETRPATDEERQALADQLRQRVELEQQRFAEALGITVEELKAAETAVFKAHLDAQVAAGELTQEQADARLEAFERGERPDGPRGRFGRHGRGS